MRGREGGSVDQPSLAVCPQLFTLKLTLSMHTTGSGDQAGAVKKGDHQKGGGEGPPLERQREAGASDGIGACCVGIEGKLIS